MHKNSRLFYAIAACAFAIMPAMAQHTISTTLPDGASVQVQFVTPDIVKVANVQAGQTMAPSKLLTPEAKPFETVESDYANGQVAVLSSKAISVALNKANGEVVINGGANRIITDTGVRQAKDGKQVLTLLTTSTGEYYGAGERGHKLNLRGDTLTMYNRQNYGYTAGDPRINQMNITMPLFLAEDGFAIVFDDHAAAQMVLADNGEITYATEGSAPVAYYYVQPAQGKALAGVVEELSSITGRQPLPPFWSLGYITSKYGYHDEGETLGAIDSLKQAGYPVDGIVLDLYWYGKEQDMGRLDWEPTQWPDPEKMLKQLKDENVNLVAISQPYVLRNGKAIDNYNYLAANGMLVADSTGLATQEVKIWVGEGGMLDISNPATRQWLASQYKRLTDMGVGGWWGDLGEPEVHPETGLHANGESARIYHNQYGNDWSEIISDLFAQQYPERRLLTMMRGGTTGLQRYSVFPWSTDVSRSWGGLQPQITIMLNSGLSGLGYMGHDVGGFAIDPANPTDPELYVRWLQLGLFSPMLRTHAQYMAEPYHYPEYANVILALVKERYRWLPYNYTIAFENATNGAPLVRPINYYGGDVKTDSLADEYLWGPDVLVAPVLNQGATSRQVTFPAGKWVDMAKPEQVYSGGSTIEYPAPLQVLPLFARAGSFIPLADYKMESTADYNPSKVTVNYYSVPGIEGQGLLYDDDRMSPNSLQDGEYRVVFFDGNTDEKGNISITFSTEGTYPGAPEVVEFDLAIHGLRGLPAAANLRHGVADIISMTDTTVKAHIKLLPGTANTFTVNY